MLTGAKGCTHVPYFDTKIIDFPRNKTRDYKMINRRTLTFKYSHSSDLQSADGYVCVSPQDWGNIREAVIGAE